MTQVHNHGPYDGPGVRCPENVVYGQLTGECLVSRPPDYLVSPHRADCGCSYCLRPTVRALDTGPDKRTPLERDLDRLMAEVPDTWYGGREVTDGIKPYSGDCDHERTTKYLTGKWCRDCGRWI